MSNTPSYGQANFAARLAGVKTTECKTETHSVIEHTKHGVVRKEVTTKRKAK